MYVGVCTYVCMYKYKSKVYISRKHAMTQFGLTSRYGHGKEVQYNFIFSIFFKMILILTVADPENQFFGWGVAKGHQRPLMERWRGLIYIYI